jgi:hypothetical protein
MTEQASESAFVLTRCHPLYQIAQTVVIHVTPRVSSA